MNILRYVKILVHVMPLRCFARLRVSNLEVYGPKGSKVRGSPDRGSQILKHFMKDMSQCQRTFMPNRPKDLVRGLRKLDGQTGF